MLEQIQEGGLGPVDVVDHCHHRAVAGQQLHEASSAPVDLVQRKLFCAKSRCRRKAICNIVVFNTGQNFFARDLRRVILQYLRRLDDHLAQRPERDALPVGKAAAENNARATTEPVEQFTHQSRLSHARIANHRHQPGTTVGDDPFPRALQNSEFFIAPNDRRVVAPHVAVVPVGGDQAIGAYRLRLTL